MEGFPPRQGQLGACSGCAEGSANIRLNNETYPQNLH